MPKDNRDYAREVIQLERLLDNALAFVAKGIEMGAYKNCVGPQLADKIVAWGREYLNRRENRKAMPCHDCPHNKGG